MTFEKTVCALPNLPKLPNLPNVRASAPTNYFSGESGSRAITA